MKKRKRQDKLLHSISAKVETCRQESVPIPEDELLQIESVLQQLSMFSKQPSPDNYDRIVNSLQSLIKILSDEEKKQEKEVSIETHGGREFTPDFLKQENGLGYRLELKTHLEGVLNELYKDRQAFKLR